MRERVGHPAAEFGRNRLEHDREGAGRFEGERVVEQPLARVAAALHPTHPAEHVDALWGQAEMSHDRDAGRNQHLDLGNHCATTFQLDRLGAALLEMPHGIGQRQLRSRLVAAEGQVGHDQSLCGAADHGLNHRNQLVHRDWHGVGVAEHQLPAGITDEQCADVGLLKHLRVSVS